MGLINFVTGKKDSNPVQPQGKANTPLFQNYGYQHAKNTRINDSVGFDKKVRDVHWDKLMRKTGKANFKTRSGEVVGRTESKRIISDMIKKAGYRGLSGRQIKDKLVRNHGLTHEDAGEIARAATYHYYEPPAAGPTWRQLREQKKMEENRRNRNVLETVMARGREEGSADTFRDRRNAKNAIKKSFESEDSARLGVEQRKYRVGALAGSEISEGDLRGSNFQGRKMPQASAAAPGAGAARVAGGYGAKLPDKLGGIGRNRSGGGVAPLGFRKGVK